MVASFVSEVTLVFSTIFIIKAALRAGKQPVHFRLLLVAALLLGSIFSRQATQEALSAPSDTSANQFASSLHGKLIVGYQGWFGFPGDYQNCPTWDHWSFKIPDKDNLIVDMLPTTDEYPEDGLRQTAMVRSDGTKISLFTNTNPGVVNKHFQWMSQYGIDGAACQRFVADVAYPAGRERRDKILQNVQKAAEANGRVFFITYDVSGENEQSVYNDLQRDWQHLVKDLHICSSPNYLKHNGKPVLQIWGFGFKDRPGEPDKVKELLTRFKTGDNGVPAVTLIGGVPTGWRNRSWDSKSDAKWTAVYTTYDVISPWMVNRFGNELIARLFIKFMLIPEMAETKRLGLEYMPVIFPGFSRYNLMHSLHPPKAAVLNAVPRNSGRFYWRQIHDLLGAHASMLYAAMFDEVNEGTALFKVETKKERLPAGAHLLYAKLDGEDVPPDRFLHLTGLANQFLRCGDVPPDKAPE